MVSRKSCKMTIKIYVDGKIKPNKKATHSCSLTDHAQSQVSISASATLEEEIKKFVADKLQLSGIAAYESFMKEQDIKNKDVPGYFSIGKKKFLQVFYEERRKLYPCEKDFQEYFFYFENLMTFDGTSFILEFGKININKSNIDIGIFASPYQLQQLSKAKGIFVDCTFKCSPKNYTQILTILIKDEDTGIHLPCLWVVLANKEEKLYEYVFLRINIALQLMGKDLELDIIYCDFEKVNNI